MPTAGRMLYGSAKPCGFSIAKVTFLGHARAEPTISLIRGGLHPIAWDEAIIKVEQEAGLSLLATA
jgi:hypothetical protein